MTASLRNWVEDECEVRLSTVEQERWWPQTFFLVYFFYFFIQPWVPEGVCEVRLSTEEAGKTVTTDMSAASLRSLQEGISRRTWLSCLLGGQIPNTLQEGISRRTSWWWRLDGRGFLKRPNLLEVESGVPSRDWSGHNGDRKFLWGGAGTITMGTTLGTTAGTTMGTGTDIPS